MERVGRRTRRGGARRRYAARAARRPRRAPAVWDIAEAFGRHATVVNWWTAWPPTDSSVSVFDAPVELLNDAVAPPALGPRLQPFVIPVQTVGYPQIRRFLNITSAEY